MAQLMEFLQNNNLSRISTKRSTIYLTEQGLQKVLK